MSIMQITGTPAHERAREYVHARARAHTFTLSQRIGLPKSEKFIYELFAR